jgi:cytochrome d ubiquinol oxidase subunit I
LIRVRSVCRKNFLSASNPRIPSGSFLDSTFLGIWLFGWEKLPKEVHAASMWLAAIGSNLSALCIQIANSFMQEPVGYVIREGRAEMTNFLPCMATPMYGFASTMYTPLAGSLQRCLYWGSAPTTLPEIRRSTRCVAVYGSITSVLVSLIGHPQAQYMVRTQPARMAAA